MKKNFKWLLALVAMVASVNLMAGVTDLSESLDLTTKKASANAYNTSTVYGDWTIVNGANNNKSWAYFKMGGKNTTISSYNPCYIYYSAASGVSSQVDSITVSIAAGSLSKADMSVNSWGVYVYSDKDMKTQIDYVAGGTITKNAATFGFKPTDGVTWAAGSYYKVSWDLANTTTTNGIVCVDKVTLHSISDTPDPVLQSIAISGTPTKTTYEAGETFDPAGLIVTGTYSDESTAEITSGIDWLFDPETLFVGTTTCDVLASVGEIMSDVYTVSGLTVMAALPKISNWNTLFKTSYTGNISGLKGENDLVLEGTTDFGVTVKVENHAAKNGYIKDQDLRLYTNNSGDYTFTVTAPTGKIFKQIVATKANGGKDIAVKEKDEKGTISVDGTSGAMTWTGKANSLVFVPTATTGFGTMTFVIAESAPSAATPTITPSTEADLYWEPITVTLATTTEGAAIYYTTNGDAPTAASTLYEAPFQVSATTTVKAIAVKEGLDNSEVASKIFNFGKVFDNIAACFADETLQNEDVVKISNVSAVITSFAKSGKTVYFEGGSFYVNATYPQTYAIGGTLSGSNLQFTFMNYDPKQLRPASWETLTYTAPGEPTSINNVKANAKATKAIVNGQIVIVRDNKTYNVLGF